MSGRVRGVWATAAVCAVVCAVVCVGAAPATRPASTQGGGGSGAEVWAKDADGTPTDLLSGWSKGGRAPAAEGKVVTRGERKWLLLDPKEATGGGAILEVARKATVPLGKGVEATAEVNFVDGKSTSAGGDVLVLLRAGAGNARYQLNVGPSQLTFGSVREGKYAAGPGARTAVGVAGTAVKVRVRLEVKENGDHALSAFVNDAAEPALTALYAAAATDEALKPAAMASVRLAVGVQNGFAAEFTGLDLVATKP